MNAFVVYLPYICNVRVYAENGSGNCRYFLTVRVSSMKLETETPSSRTEYRQPFLLSLLEST
jgi:hypothetical protein